MSEVKTVTKVEDSKYGILFGVYNVVGEDKDGNDILSEKAIVRFGKKKAVAIADHIEDLKSFILDK